MKYVDVGRKPQIEIVIRNIFHVLEISQDLLQFAMIFFHLT